MIALPINGRPIRREDARLMLAAAQVIESHLERPDAEQIVCGLLTADQLEWVLSRRKHPSDTVVEVLKRVAAGG